MQLKYFDPTKIRYHPKAEKLTQYLCNHCENDSPMFFRMIVAYHLAKIASVMRATIKNHRQSNLPVNLYVVDLAPSGSGKTKAMNFMEEDVTHLFHERFQQELLPQALQKNIAKLAVERTLANEELNEEHVMARLKAEYDAVGEWVNAFDSATPAALKQFRHKLLLTKAGALNFEIDEIGKNLTGNSEGFAKYLELYDKGKIKGSLVKNTRENTRLSEVKGNTPSNLIMFGTPSSLLDGAKIEEEFFKMLEEGYARRCFFGYTNSVNRNLGLTVEEIYDRNVEKTSSDFIDQFSQDLADLAEDLHFNTEITMDKNEDLMLLEYQQYCLHRANEISKYNFIERAEMEHRYFKSVKLAATYAFIDGSTKITSDHLYYAIALAEESGEGISSLLNREMPYVKLAKFLGESRNALTQVELHEYLPFYKGTKQVKDEMLDFAVAYGYQNNIIIKRQYHDGILFLNGESLEETDLDKLTVAYSEEQAYEYFNDTVKWESIAKLVSMDGMVYTHFNWITHHLEDDHRCDDKTLPGTNLLVLDIDGEVPLNVAQKLLENYKFLTHTTKRHGVDGIDRFRIIMPMKYKLKLDASEYKEFMAGVFDWLPFDVDDKTGQRSRKWACTKNTTLFENDGELFDPIAFIPKTTKNEKRKQKLLDQQSLTNLERWFVNNTGEGNRNNQLSNYALMLVDNGKTIVQTEQAVMAMNEKLQDPLPEDEITHTIMVSARKAFNKLNHP